MSKYKTIIYTKKIINSISQQNMDILQNSELLNNNSIIELNYHYANLLNSSKNIITQNSFY